MSWLQREKLGCELCWDPGPFVSPGHGHAQSTLHSEASLPLGVPHPADSHLVCVSQGALPAGSQTH